VKRILLILFTLLLPLICYGQNKDLPKFYIVNKDTLGIILSMDQLKRMKNDLELKSYFEASAISCDSFVNKAIIVIDECETKVRFLNLRISKLDSLDSENQVLLNNCLNRLQNDGRNKILCDSQRANDSLIIGNLGKEINTLKFEKMVSWWGAGSFLLSSIILAIILAVH